MQNFQNTGHPAEALTHFQGREIQLYGDGQPAFQGGSSYKQDYPAHPYQGARAPNGNGRQFAGNTAPFEGASSYKQDYPAHQHEARPPAPGAQYQPNPAPFDGSTAYNDTYRGHPIDPSAQNRAYGAKPYNPNTAPFEGTSSYKSDFPQHTVSPRERHGAGPYQPNNAPFDGTSHYKDDFKAHQLEPRGPIAQPTTHHNSAPFEGSTLYKDDFRAHPMEARPPAPGAQYQPNPAPFQGSTEAGDQYKAWPVDPAAAQRRGPPPVMRPSAPFDGSSTYKQQFKGWKLPARRPALGVQMLGDRTHVLIPADAPLPATGRQVFTTVHDNQPEICVLVLRGDAAVASRNNVIGQFNLTGLPPGPKGGSRVEITFQVDANNVLSAVATDLDANRQEQWLRQGSMTAQAHATDIITVV